MVKSTRTQSTETSKSLRDEFPEVWKNISSKKIPQKEINKFLLELQLKIIKEIEEGVMPSSFIYTLNDLWALIVNAGYKLNPEVEDYILDLTNFDTKRPHKQSPIIDYIDAPSEETYWGNIPDIKKRAKELLFKFK